jgi:glycosyltransferase involved in cell wall biosynthesis
MKNLSIVIPCYNEEGNILELFNNLEKLINLNNNLEIIIVDNGSTDSSLAKIKDHSLYKNKLIKLVVVEKNLGYGNGIMSGIYKSSTKYISWCHADLQTPPQYACDAFKKNFDKLEKQKVIIKGKRVNRDIFDQLFTFGMSIVASLLFGNKLTDINAQPKIFSRQFLSLLKNPPNDFSLDVYLMVVAIQNQYKIIEYPVSWDQRVAGEAKGGGSIKAKIRITIQTLKCILNLKKNFFRMKNF